MLVLAKPAEDFRERVRCRLSPALFLRPTPTALDARIDYGDQMSRLLRRRMRATELQEFFGEVFHAVPFRVHVVTRGEGVRVALVDGSLWCLTTCYRTLLDESSPLSGD